METEEHRDASKKAREGLLLFVIFGTLIVALIGVMFFIDYYADSRNPDAHPLHDAADS